jgi:hypothetical protein
MPRFGIKTLLVGLTVVAVWFSTFTNYRMAEDVRRSILLLILVSSGMAALWGRGRGRAFWVGFFAAMLLCAGSEWQRPLSRYVPEFMWQWNTAIYSPPTPQPVIMPSPPTPVTANYVASAPIYIAAGSVTTSVSNWSVALNATLVALWILALSSLAGLASVFLFNRDHTTKSKADGP